MSDSTLVVKEGVTYGTAVTPDRTFCLLNSGESLDYDPDYQWSGAHCWGKRGPHANARVLVSHAAGGDIPLELSTVGFGFWWKMCLGSVTNTQVGATSVYQQVHTMATSNMPFFTAQKLTQSHTDAGVFSTHAATFNSLAVASWTLTIPESGIATLTVTTVGHSVITTTAAVTPASRSTDDHLLHSGGASLSTGTIVAPTATALASAPNPVAGVRSLTIEVDNNLIVRRSGWGKARPLPGAAPSVTGTLDVEFITGSPFVSAWMDGTVLSLLAQLDAIENGDELVQIVIPGLHVGGELPKAGDPTEMQRLSVPFTGVLTGSETNLITVVNRTYDTTV